MNGISSVKDAQGLRFLPRQLNEKSRTRHYFLIYTVLFLLACCIVFCWYFFDGRTFIWYKDGWSQHYKALVYYAQYLRSFIRDLLYHHRFVFPEWEFAFGEGGDILQTLNYYVIGDPFTVFSVLVPTRFMWIYYDFMILLRLYLAGIAFSCLCFYTKKNVGRCAVLAGAISYVFCYWAILNVNRHPYFLNPMLYFPLIILGIEKLLRKEKAFTLIVSVFLAAISNFYFFYNIVIMTAVYVAVRLIAKYQTDIKSMAKMLLRIAGGSAVGTMMGGIIILPVAFAFLNDPRMGSGNAWHLVYPLSYYSKLLVAFLCGSGDYWLSLGYCAPVILAIFLMFLRKKNGVLKTYFLIGVTIILIPALGQFLNGMSYMSNKWCWAFSLLCAYLFTIMWSELMHLQIKEAVKLLACLSGYCLAMFVQKYSRATTAFLCAGIAFIFLLVIFPFRIKSERTVAQWEKWKPIIALTLVVIGVASISFIKNSSIVCNYVEEAKTISDVEDQLMTTEANAVKVAADEEGITGFYRYTGRNLTENASALAGISCTEYYWSMTNPCLNQNMRELEFLEILPHRHTGYNDRTALISLASVLYYVTPSGKADHLPYGMSYVDTVNIRKESGTGKPSDGQPNAAASCYEVYRNDYALPLAYTYDTILSETAWRERSAVEKQEAMLQSVLLAGYNGQTQDSAVNFSSKSVDYTITCNDSGITLEDYGFVVTSYNSSVTINFEGLPNSETYLSIHGLDFEGVPVYELYFGDERYDPLDLFTKEGWNNLTPEEQKAEKKNHLFWTEPTGVCLKLQSSSGATKTLSYNTENFNWYNDRHDFTVNLCYAPDAATSIMISFSDIGVYSFDSIEVVCLPMDNYVGQISALHQTPLENINIGIDTVSGTILLDDPKILCFSIPYSTGWTAYVDGKEATIYQANVKSMALVLDEGKHDIALVYHTPFLRPGAAMSILGLVCVFAYAIWTKKCRLIRTMLPGPSHKRRGDA